MPVPPSEPDAVADVASRIDVRSGVDTDGDTLPDTLVFDDDETLVLASDTDYDGLADVIVEIGPDAGVRTTLLDPEPGNDWSAGTEIGMAHDPGGAE